MDLLLELEVVLSVVFKLGSVDLIEWECGSFVE